MKKIIFKRLLPKLMLLSIATGSIHAQEAANFRTQLEVSWRNLLHVSGWDTTDLDWNTLRRYKDVIEDNREYVITKENAPSLIFQASAAGRIKLVKFLIEQGTDVSARDEYGHDIALYIKCCPVRVLSKHGNEEDKANILTLIKILKDDKRAQETAQAQQEAAQAEDAIAACGRSEAQSGEAAQVATIILAYLLPLEETDDTTAK